MSRRAGGTGSWKNLSTAQGRSEANEERRHRVLRSLGELRRLAVIAQGADARRWLELELTMGQLKGLFALAQGGPMPVGRLAEVLGVSEPTASALVDRLARLGLVRREEDNRDRRRTLVSLSPRGEGQVAALRHGGEQLLERALVRLEDGELEALAHGLEALARALEAEVAEAASTGNVSGRTGDQVGDR
ncbi:MAG: MarR family transcriptional regulator [Bacillota bacterium]|nr:MarR family transcriptional regulator [Bacillota bacterium]